MTNTVIPRIAALAPLLLAGCYQPVVEVDGGVPTEPLVVCGERGRFDSPFTEALKDCQRVLGGVTFMGFQGEVVSAPNLATVKVIDGALRFDRMPNATELAGFDTLEEVGEVSIHRAPQLRSLAGLQGLKRVHGFILGESVGVSALDQMSGLSRLSGRLGLNSTNVASLTAFSQTEELETLVLLNNRRLTSLAGLGALRMVTGDVEIRDNAIPKEEIDAFLARVEVRGRVSRAP
ncbi:MAG: leucine-rich repeat domain-containing protein [Myxococcaceae bacterium]|jgi:hypothetical protein|nr:leucine-rich repeat domain-containing protein [Myxococcaceae bacterium]MCA3013132.1 leucine-rich repeat domain-containing protein [Myxococcaceae bacterium]